VASLPSRSRFIGQYLAENVVADMALKEPCVDAVDGVLDVYNLAADMGGMGFIEALSEEERLKYRQFTYYIQLRNWDGQLLASHEPIIDNLGPPAPGSGRYEGSAP